MDGINFMLVLVLIQVAVGLAAAYPIAKPDCRDECGGVKIPFPFGIGDGCFFNHTDESSGLSFGVYYKITCNETPDPPTPIYGTDIPLLNITVGDHSLRLNTRVAYDCYRNNQSSIWSPSSLRMVQFTVNTTRNKFVAIGCDTKASISGYRLNNDYYYTGCMTYCTSLNDIQNGTCSGVGCCETPVPDGTARVYSSLFSYYNHSKFPLNPCSAAFVIEDGEFTFSTANLTSPESHFKGLHVPAVFDWSILSATCNPPAGQEKPLCGFNTECVDRENATKGYRCKCLSGYAGNPYLSQGCQDVDECRDPKLNKCEKQEYCVNTVGGYDCRCPKGYHGNATQTDRCTANPLSVWSNLPTGAKVSIALLVKKKK